MHENNFADDVFICALPNLLSLQDQDLIPKELMPAYGGESAGLDLYNAGPDLSVAPLTTFDTSVDTCTNWEESPGWYRKLGYKTLMPTGIKVAIPKGYVGLILERGSVTKTPLKVRAGVIDSGYTGQVFVNMINISPIPYKIASGEKSAFQLVIVPIKNTFHLCTSEQYEKQTSNSARQSGKIGSSDK